jgi:2,2-dialkylglycine decarboxylase (pyruvate)
MADRSAQRRSKDLLAQARELFVRSFWGGFELPVIKGASGTVITDVDGKDYLDFSSGQMCATVGHNHPQIVEAVVGSGARALHLNSSMLAPEVVHLARRLTDLLPAPLKKVFFFSTGGESTEAALKMAKKATGKFETVALADGFHGSTAGALSSTFIPKRRAGHGPLLPGTHAIFAPNCYRCLLQLTFPDCEYACARRGMELVDKQSVGSLAALIAEPIQGAGGIVEPPPGYLEMLRELCREREMLFILDEAQTGLGRVGEMWGFEQDQAAPDILAMSKTLGGGIPLAATATSPAIEERCFENGFWFYTSHLNEPLPAAVGLAVLDVIRDEKLVDAAREKGAYLKKGLPGAPLGRGLRRGSRHEKARRSPGSGRHSRLSRARPLHGADLRGWPVLRLAGRAAPYDLPCGDRPGPHYHGGGNPGLLIAGFAMSPHIPNKEEQMVRYYGYYSNVCRGRRQKENKDCLISSILEPDEDSKAYRKNWARLIRKICEPDPCSALLSLSVYFKMN